MEYSVDNNLKKMWDGVTMEGEVEKAIDILCYDNGTPDCGI